MPAEGLTEPALRKVINGHPAVLPALSGEARWGRVWFQRDERDCFRPTVASALGVHYDELEGVRSIADLIDWAAGRGSRVNFHDEPPSDGRVWIGLTPPLLEEPEASEYRDRYGVEPNHAFVGLGRRVLHDPASGWGFPAGIEPVPPTAVETILTVDPA